MAEQKEGQNNNADNHLATIYSSVMLMQCPDRQSTICLKTGSLRNAANRHHILRPKQASLGTKSREMLAAISSSTRV